MKSLLTLGAFVAVALAPINAPAYCQKPPAHKMAPGANQPITADPQVKRLLTTATTLAAQSRKHPADAALKNKTAEAYYQTAHVCETSPKLMPHSRYVGALRLYRTALALNPKHEKAAAEKKQIEDVYKSMGRPIPQ